MGQKLKYFSGYILAAIFLTISIVLFIKVNALNEKFKNTDLKNASNSSSAHNDKLILLDSLVIDGAYDEALKAATEIREIEDSTLGDEFNMRFKVISELLDFKKERKYLLKKEVLLQNKIDSVVRFNNSKIDSLKLELANNKVDVYYLEQKINALSEQKSKKSYGEYLTFSTTKGKSLHYIGEVNGEMANGFGIAVLESGSRYEGEWKNNMRHGNGEFYWDDGEYYKGNYKNDLRDGYGVYVFENGQKYVGQWKKDMREGLGKFFDKNGKLIAEGTWVKDELKEQE